MQAPGSADFEQIFGQVFDQVFLDPKIHCTALPGRSNTVYSSTVMENTVQSSSGTSNSNAPEKTNETSTSILRQIYNESI